MPQLFQELSGCPVTALGKPPLPKHPKEFFPAYLVEFHEDLVFGTGAKYQNGRGVHRIGGMDEKKFFSHRFFCRSSTTGLIYAALFRACHGFVKIVPGGKSRFKKTLQNRYEPASLLSRAHF